MTTELAPGVTSDPDVMSKQPEFIDALKTLRAIRGITLQEALRHASKIFREKGWRIPDSFQPMIAKAEPSQRPAKKAE